VAALLYGVGAKLDQNPALLFLLRGVDPAGLISKASATEAVRQTAATADGAPVMSETEVADVFGIELAPASVFSVPAVELPASTQTPAPAPHPASSGNLP
jgi:uncharacterized Zn finger protein